jgi:hypothetical protein
MECAKCRNTLAMCICDDFDERLARLEESPYLKMDWQGLKLARFLNTFERERLKKETKNAKYGR